MPASREQAAQSVERFAPGDVPRMSAKEIVERRARDAAPILVDVRSRDEMAVSMLPGAWTRERFERVAATEPETLAGRTIVPYCTVGARSGAFARQLKARGFADVYNGEGVVLWTHDVDEPLIALDAAGSEAPTRRVHVYGAPWDLARSDYEAVRFGPLQMVWRAVCG